MTVGPCLQIIVCAIIVVQSSSESPHVPWSIFSTKNGTRFGNASPKLYSSLSGNHHSKVTEDLRDLLRSARTGSLQVPALHPYKAKSRNDRRIQSQKPSPSATPQSPRTKKSSPSPSGLHRAREAGNEDGFSSSDTSITITQISPLLPEPSPMTLVEQEFPKPTEGSTQEPPFISPEVSSMVWESELNYHDNIAQPSTALSDILNTSPEPSPPMFENALEGLDSLPRTKHSPPHPASEESAAKKRKETDMAGSEVPPPSTPVSLPHMEAPIPSVQVPIPFSPEPEIVLPRLSEPRQWDLPLWSPETMLPSPDSSVLRGPSASDEHAGWDEDGDVVAPESYAELVPGKNVRYVLVPRTPIYSGPPLKPPDTKGQLLLVYKRYRKGYQLPLREAETTERDILIIRTCFNIEREGFEQIVDDIAGATLAFSQDPRLSNPRLVAASTEDIKERGKDRCHMKSRIEVPVHSHRELFVLVSTGASAGKAVALIESSIAVASSLVPVRKPWQVDALGGPTGSRNETGTQSQRLQVYVLSSVPLLEHSELSDVHIDSTAMSYLSAGLGSSDADPFCHPLGTMIAAALCGKRLGNGPPHITLVPVPIRSCKKKASLHTVLEGLLWIKTHVGLFPENKAWIILEDSRIVSSLSVGILSILSTLAKEGSMIIVPNSDCRLQPQGFLFSVGPYHKAMTGKITILKSNGPCVNQIDIFAPGLRVITASTSGPMAYRHVAKSTDVAVASVVGALLRLISGRHDFNNVYELRALVRKSLSHSEVFLGDTNDAVRVLVLKNDSLALLNKTTFSSTGTQPSSSDSKVANSSIPGISTNALIGICAGAGVIVSALLLGAAIYVKRRAVDDSDFSYFTSTSRPDGGASGNWTLDQQDGRLARPTNLLSLPTVETESPSHPGEAHCDGRSAGAGPEADRKAGADSRLPVVRRLLSKAKNSHSLPVPQTPNAKASWFATPKASSASNQDGIDDGT